MSHHFSLYINEQLAFEHECDTELDDRQRAFLDTMDSDMDRGIKIRGELYQEPGAEQRSQFMCMNLLKALRQEDNAKIAVSCAYLCQRRPNLKEIHARDEDGSVVIELVDEEH